MTATAQSPFQGPTKYNYERKEDANLMERVAIMANYADGAMK